MSTKKPPLSKTHHLGHFHDMLRAQGLDVFETAPSVASSQVHLPDAALWSNKLRRNEVNHHAVRDPESRRAIGYKAELAAARFNISPAPLVSALGWTPEQVRKFRQQARDAYEEFIESDSNWVDITGRHNGSGIAYHYTRNYLTSSESLAQFVDLTGQRNRRSPLSFAVRLIDQNRIATPTNIDSGIRSRVKDGILFGSSGSALGAYIRRYAPYDSAQTGTSKGYTSNLTNDSFSFVRTRDSEGRIQLLHSFIQVLPDLARGVSELASTLCLSEQRDEFRNSALEDQIGKAGLTFIIKSLSNQMDDVYGLLSGDQDLVDSSGEKHESKMSHIMAESGYWHNKTNNFQKQKRGNMILRLLHGEDVEAFDSKASENYDMFSESIDRIAAAAHNLPFDEYRQHHTGSYSASRAAKVYLWEIIQGVRRDSSFPLIRGIYDRGMEDFIRMGAVELPGFGNRKQQARAFYRKHRVKIAHLNIFGAPQREIDQAKTASAYLSQQKLGAFTLEDYCATVFGVHWEDRISQIIAEVKFSYDTITKMCGEPPNWSVADVATQRIFGDSAQVSAALLEQGNGPQNQNPSNRPDDDEDD